MNRVKSVFSLLTCITMLAGMALLVSVFVWMVIITEKEYRQKQQGTSHNADSGYGSKAPATLPANPPLEK